MFGEINLVHQVIEDKKTESCESFDEDEESEECDLSTDSSFEKTQTQLSDLYVCIQSPDLNLDLEKETSGESEEDVNSNEEYSEVVTKQKPEIVLSFPVESRRIASQTLTCDTGTGVNEIRDCISSVTDEAVRGSGVSTVNNDTNRARQGSQYGHSVQIDGEHEVVQSDSDNDDKNIQNDHYHGESHGAIRSSVIIGWDKNKDKVTECQNKTLHTASSHTFHSNEAV